MKEALIAIVLITSVPAVAQPWKIEEDFKIAFIGDYATYRLSAEKRGSTIWYVGYAKNDSGAKVFEFETLVHSSKKEGWFTYFGGSNAKPFSIFFANGKARKLSYTNDDSLVFTFSIDSNLLNGVHTVYYANGNIKEYGFYKNNARTGKWIFCNPAGKITSEGSFAGDYNKLIYDTKASKIITLNRYLDTVRLQAFTQKKYDSLKRELNQQWGLVFPIHLHFKTGIWRYYDDNGKVIRKEFYEKGKQIKIEVTGK